MGWATQNMYDDGEYRSHVTTNGNNSANNVVNHIKLPLT